MTLSRKLKSVKKAASPLLRRSTSTYHVSRQEIKPHQACQINRIVIFSRKFVIKTYKNCSSSLGLPFSLSVPVYVLTDHLLILCIQPFDEIRCNQVAHKL